MELVKIQNEIDKLIERNKKLIEAKIDFLNDFKKINEGLVINNSFLSTGTYRITDDGFVELIVHPNFVIHTDTNGDFPYFTYGCAYDLLRFPIEKMHTLCSRTIKECYNEVKDEFMAKRTDKLKSVDKDISAIEGIIQSLLEDLEHNKERLKTAKYISEHKEAYIKNIGEQYADNVEDYINGKDMSDNISETEANRLFKTIPSNYTHNLK